MPTALFVSPHLDDVAFSAGGLCARLADDGWRVVIATVFTASVPNPTGFALACQTDKGLPPDADYMALRRAEDAAAAAILGAEIAHGPLAEAPHRGYASAAALFGPVHAADPTTPVRDLLDDWTEIYAPDLIVGPQGLGNHVDHQLVIAASSQIPENCRAAYRDTPYAIRSPLSAPNAGVMGRDIPIAIGDQIGRKVAACRAYATQTGFQFGGDQAVGPTLRAFAAAEAGRSGAPDLLAERYLSSASALDAYSWV